MTAPSSSDSDSAVRIEAAVRDALVMIQPNAAGLDGDADLAREVGLDSVQVMDMIMEIEDSLDISVPVEVLAQARTVNELRDGIGRLIGSSS
ncbi:acyl carrier protein [Algiphilus sp. W345]|uniref:Acyl carrier protein n=1 Tax=Banduia mediterranea TaxID=3075609 RepID=A0ABU2WMJ5_9GAMM|nr:acyl carrier protein [Algiphilus sp. W345]MDT0498778.1 acyl carrier protein [Algiphilus sp. W345]